MTDLYKTLRTQILREGSLRAWAKKHGINPGVVYRVLNGGDSPSVRAALGLPPKLVEVQPCICGGVHQLKGCNKNRPPKRYKVTLEFKTKEQQQKAIAILAYFGGNRIDQSYQLMNIVDQLI